MPTSGKPGDRLVDTSVALALVVADHTAHAATTTALEGLRLGLAGHAAFETFSVLTRLPPPARRTAASATRVLTVDFPITRFLSPGAASELLTHLGRLAISGGAVYDALVGAAAAEHGMTLVTRDRRALGTYRSLDVDVEVLD